MIELAIHTPTRHLQAVLAQPGLLVFRPPGGDWSLKRLPAERPRAPRFELLGLGDRVLLKSTLELAGVTANGLPADPHANEPLALPLRFVADDTRVEVVQAPGSRSAQERAPVSLEEASAHSAGPAHAGPAPATLARWFEALSTLNRWPAGADAFFQSAASLVVDPIGLDGAYVLTRGDHGSVPWDFSAAVLPLVEQGVWLDLSLVDETIRRGDTLLFGTGPESRVGAASACVVAPWRDGDGRVIGAVVGVRSVHAENARRNVRPLEANLVRLLAQTIGDLQARRAREQVSARRRVLLEQAFTPELAARIEADPEVLRGAAREVSLVFADLRDATRIFQRPAHSGEGPDPLAPVEAFELLRDLLDAMTEAALRHSGVIIDYYGDGLAAMWNAPVDQPDHARLAVDAGLDMISAITEAAREWAPRLGWEPRLAVGVHTGSAMVGDIGSRWKVKYGARGLAVNLASRVEQATKHIGAPILITDSTRQRLPAGFSALRLCRARLAGIDREESLYHVRRSGEQACGGLDEALYAEALALFEAGRLDAAMRRVASCEEASSSGPLAFLSEQIRKARAERRGRRQGDAPLVESHSAIDFAAIP